MYNISLYTYICIYIYIHTYIYVYMYIQHMLYVTYDTMYRCPPGAAPPAPRACVRRREFQMM